MHCWTPCHQVAHGGTLKSRKRNWIECTAGVDCNCHFGALHVPKQTSTSNGFKYSIAQVIFITLFDCIGFKFMMARTVRRSPFQDFSRFPTSRSHTVSRCPGPTFLSWSPGNQYTLLLGPNIAQKNADERTCSGK